MDQEVLYNNNQMQPRNSNESSDSNPKSQNSLMTTKQPGQSHHPTLSPPVSVKQSSIEQQLLQIKLQKKIDITNENLLVNFINRIIHLLSEAMVNFKPIYVTEIINTLLTKVTMVNFTTSMSPSQKLQQIAKWKFVKLLPTASHLLGSIAGYVIGQVDLDNFQDILTMLFFLLLWQIEIDERTLEAFNWALKKFIHSHQEKQNLFVKGVIKMVLDYFDNRNSAYSSGLVLLYANCFIILLKFYQGSDDVVEVEKHLENFGLIQALFTQSSQKNNENFSQGKELCFFHCCEVYALTGSTKLLTLIKLFIEMGATATMVRNCWSLLNADHKLQIFTFEGLAKIDQVLNILKDKTNQNGKFCRMAPRGALIFKVLEKKTSLIILKFLMAHPWSIKNKNQFVLQIQLELGTMSFCVRESTKEDAKVKPYEMVVKTQLRNPDQNLRERQQVTVSGLLDSILETMVLELRDDKKLLVCSEGTRLAQVNHAIFGRAKSITVGFRKEQKVNQCILRKIFILLTLEDVTFEQYLNQKDNIKGTTSVGLATSLRMPYRKGLSSSTPKNIEKFDLFEHIQLNAKQPVSQKIKLSTKSFSIEGIDFVKQRQYKKMVSQSNDKQKLFAYILNAFEGVKNDGVLEEFINIIKKQSKAFELGEDDLYCLTYLHDQALFFRKPISLVEELIDFISVPPSKIQSPLKSQKQKPRNEDQQRILFFRLQFLFKTLLQGQKSETNSIVKISIDTVNHYLELSSKIPKQEIIKSVKRLTTFLNTAMLSYIYDYGMSVQGILKEMNEDFSINENSNYSKTEKMDCQLFLTSTESSTKLFGLIHDCLKLVIGKHNTSDVLIIQCIGQSLQLVLVILSHVALSGTPFHADALFCALESSQQILMSFSSQLAQLKSINEAGQHKICILLSQMYNILPVLQQYTGKKDSQLKEEDLSRLLKGNSDLRADPFTRIMSEMYTVCFFIGSYCMKDKKNGFLTYMAYAYQFLSNYSTDSTVTNNDKITVNQLFQSCFKFMIGRGFNSCHSLDKQTILHIVAKLKELNEENSEVFPILIHPEKINAMMAAYQQKNSKEKRKQSDSSVLNFHTKDPETYFYTQMGQFCQESKESSLKQSSTKRVAQKIFAYCRQYFLEAYSKMVKDKNNAMVAYYKMIEKLSLQQKILNKRASRKYQRYDYYILDDFLNSQNVKVMLKRDPICILGNIFSGEIPRLYQETKINKHTIHALKITKNLQNLNTNPFFQISMSACDDRQAEIKQKVKITIRAFLVTKSKIYQGKIQIDQKTIKFTENTVIDKAAYAHLYAHKSEYRTLQEISVSRKQVTIKIGEVDYVEKKKYLQKFESLQVFAARLSYFFVFQDEDSRSKLIWSSKRIHVRESYQNGQKVNESVRDWKKGLISTFEFLITLNNVAGRSFNDVCQYYIFPWTVINFKDPMDEKFFQKRENFRDLAKPIGAQNPKKLQMILNKYSSCVVEPDFRQKPYMYGSFYSNAGVVCNYLLRVNPFTTHHYELQGNSFDLYDRLFTNMDDQFESIFNIALDNRELTPQFYCAPEFFRNRNRYNFAHDHPETNKVDLQMRMPKWVITKSPQEFVFRMRKVLESKIVSNKLGAWLDFIFGHKSEYETADVHHNLYMHQLYTTKQSKSLKIPQELQFSQIQNKANMIKLFGQVPKNIFGDGSVKPLEHDIATCIYSQKIQLKDLLQQKSKQKVKLTQIVHDFKQSIMTLSSKDKLVVFNTNQDLGKLKIDIEQPLQSLSIMKIKLQLHFFVFTVGISGKLSVYTFKKSEKNGILVSRGFQYKLQSKIELLPNSKYSHVKILGQKILIAEQATLKILQVTKHKTKKAIETLIDQKWYIEDKGNICIHRAPICKLETYEGLQIAASLDSSGLMNIFSLHPETLIRSTFSISPCLKISQKANKIVLHSMGILVILTNLNQIILINIYGDLIQTVRVSDTEIIDIVFWDDHSSSEVVLTTKYGLIYQFDLFDLLEEDQDCYAGLQVKLLNKRSVQESKNESKLAIFRLGRMWELYLISSIDKITAIQCKDFTQCYTIHLIFQNCNDNNSYNNS